MEKVREFLGNGDTDVIWEDYDVVVWVDWREEDEAIIRYCEDILKTGTLLSEYQDADNKLGYVLYIHYNNKKTIVPFNPDNVSRDTTLIALNQVLNPDYEVRLWIDSIGGDTLAFVPLSSAQWSELEKEFGTEKVQYHFSKINAQSKMFELSMEEVRKIMKEHGL